MLALALSVALLNQEQPARLRTICRIGAAVLVERMADEPMVSVQLWASSRSVPETPKTHGWRHLLEHLMAKGVSGQVDFKLESEGGYLRAQTLRDAMVFEINVPPKELKLAVSSILDILKPLQASEESIASEVRIMREEFATSEESSKLSRGAWSAAFAEHGLDPNGSLEVMSTATLKDLRALQSNHFYPENLVLTIAGPIDIKQTTELAVEAIGMKQGAIRTPVPERPAGKPGRVEVSAIGEGRAAIVDTFDAPKTVGALAFALAVGSKLEGAFVTYTPTTNRGLILLAQTEKSSGAGIAIDEVTDSDWGTLYATGKLLARRWVQRYLGSASGVAFIRGLLLAQNHGSRPEQMLRTIDNLTLEQFKLGARAFSKEQAVTVVGS